MSLFRIPHPVEDSMDTDVEIERVFGRVGDYLELPDHMISFSPDELVCTVLMINNRPVQLATRLDNQTEEERWGRAWERVGSHLWSVLPPQEELGEQIEVLSRD